jgi:hypothetical protein
VDRHLIHLEKASLEVTTCRSGPSWDYLLLPLNHGYLFPQLEGLHERYIWEIDIDTHVVSSAQ